LNNGSATQMRGKSLTCRQQTYLLSAVLDRKLFWRSCPASRRLAAHQRGKAIAQV